MKLKSETRKIIENFIVMVKTQFSSMIKTIRSDNGSEFIFPELYAKYGILHHTSCVATPQQNAVAERKHLHILNVTRSLLFQSHLPKVFWSYAVNYAAHLINRLPSPVLQQKTPYEMLHNMPSTLLDLKVFGSLCYASTLEHHRTKLDPRSKKCVFLGFKFGTKGYIVFDLKTREISVSRHVVFYETVFPYFKPSEQQSVFDNASHPHDDQSHFLFDIPTANNEYTSILPTHTHDTPQNQPNTTSENLDFTDFDSEGALPEPGNTARRSTRTRRAPDYLKDFHCQINQSQGKVDSLPQGNTPYPLSSVLSYNLLSPLQLAYTLAVSADVEPNSYKQAIKSKEQRKIDDWN